ncbi:MAG: phosphatase PAP2 family protein [Chlamydiota bacterium]
MIIEFKKNSFLKPSRFFRENSKIFYPLLIVFIVASYFFIDKSFALFLSSFKSDWLDILFLVNNLMNPFFTLLLFPFLFFFIRFVQRKERKSKKLWYLSFATALPIFAATFLAIIVGRSTPAWLFIHKEMIIRFFQWNPSFHSFPSVTSCNIGALAAALCYLYPKHSYKFFFLGVFVGMIPALLALCFVSDALAGICIGMLGARLVFKIMRRELSFS